VREDTEAFQTGLNDVRIEECGRLTSGLTSTLSASQRRLCL
jgi:hypothetical protein